MPLRTLLCFFALGLLCTCNATNTHNRYEAVFDETKIVWRPFKLDYLRERGKDNFMFIRFDTRPIVLSNGTIVPDNDCLSLMRINASDAAELGEAADLYNECNKLQNARPMPSIAVFVRQAEQAVRADGRCDWLGYDPAYDRWVRTTNSLASTKDRGMFFARLRCNS